MPHLSPTQTAQLDAATAYLLFSYPPLTLAVKESFGGPQSPQKREWLAGTLSEYMATAPSAEADDIGELLVQVFGDEFEMVVDDGTLEGLCRGLEAARDAVREGKGGGVVRELKGVYDCSLKGNGTIVAGCADGDDEEEDEDDEDDDGDSQDSGDGSADEMVLDAWTSKSKAPPEPPEVDEEGFTKIVKGRTRGR